MLRFEYDPNKSASNLSKHGVDFVFAQRVWEDGERLEIEAKHTPSEYRYAVFGKVAGKCYTVIITYRGSIIRIIGARVSTKLEVQTYEQ